MWFGVKLVNVRWLCNPRSCKISLTWVDSTVSAVSLSEIAFVCLFPMSFAAVCRPTHKPTILPIIPVFHHHQCRYDQLCLHCNRSTSRSLGVATLKVSREIKLDQCTNATMSVSLSLEFKIYKHAPTRNLYLVIGKAKWHPLHLTNFQHGLLGIINYQNVLFLVVYWPGGRTEMLANPSSPRFPHLYYTVLPDLPNVWSRYIVESSLGGD